MIVPPPHIASDVSVLKDDVQYLIGHTFADRHSRAAIPLFSYADRYIDDMIDFVRLRATSFRPFNLFIKNIMYSGQGNERTLYLDVVNKYPLRDLVEKLIREDSGFTPTLTLARNLATDDFQKAWPYLKDIPYSQHFPCDRITVMARGTAKKWIHYTDIEFGLQP